MTSRAGKKRLRMVLSGTRGMAGGTQGVASLIEQCFQEAGWDAEWFGPEALPKIRTSSRYPGLNEAFRALAVRRALRSLPPVELTISHGIYGAGATGPRFHLYHGTYAGLADACRGGLPRLDYLVIRWANGILEGRSGRGAQRCVVSRRVGDEVRRYYGLKAERVIHNAVDLDRFRPIPDGRSLRRKWGLPEDRFLVLVVGRLDYGKGWQVLRKMDALLPADIHFVLAAPSLGGSVSLVPGRMTRIPAVPQRELAELYAACDVLLSPSLYEGFGLTLIEAWACARPVVSGLVGFVGELQGEERSLDEALAPAGDADALAAALLRMVHDPELRDRQARWGYECARARFGLDRFRATYLELAAG